VAITVCRAGGQFRQSVEFILSCGRLSSVKCGDQSTILSHCLRHYGDVSSEPTRRRHSSSRYVVNVYKGTGWHTATHNRGLRCIQPPLGGVTTEMYHYACVQSGQRYLAKMRCLLTSPPAGMLPTPRNPPAGPSSPESSINRDLP
jgi:hypothetical protein